MKAISVSPFLLLAVTFIPEVISTVIGVTGMTCEGYSLSSTVVRNAANAALSHMTAGTTVGSDSYPHQEYDYEGFTFDRGCKKPYYEFPIVKSGTYTGGSPGTDRVIIGTVEGNTAVYCGGVTHRDASGNNFNQCRDESKKIIKRLEKKFYA